MENLLGKSCVINILHENNYLKAEGKVRSIHFDDEMSLIGFIPFSSAPEKATLLFSMNDELIVTPFRVRSKSFQMTFPVMKYITSTKGKEYFFDKNLKIASIEANRFFENKQTQIDELSQYQNKPTPLNTSSIIKKIEKKYPCLGKMIRDENGFLNYIPATEEFEFSREDNTFQPFHETKQLKVSTYTYIADSFLCLCTFINKVTGLISYAVFNPEDIIKIKK